MGARSVLRARFLAALLVCGACNAGGAAERRAAEVHVEHGNRLLRGYGCGGCHVIPGVAGADATLGPPLTRWSERRYIAGALPNSPENLAAFLVSPQRVQPGGGMPELGVTPEDAGYMAAYLFSLGDSARSQGPWHPLSSERLRRPPGG